MNSDQQNIYAFEEEDTLNLREELDKYLHYWKWFVLGVILSITFAFYYLRKTTEKYAIEATIMIKNGKSGGDLMSEMSAFQDLGVFNDVKNSIDNEMEILRSRTLIGGVIKELGLSVKYIREGRIKVREYYNNAPIKLNFLESDAVFYKTSAVLKVTILSQTNFTLENEEFGNLGTHKFGQQIKTPFGKVLITPRFKDKLPSNPEVFISIAPIDVLANGYRGAVKIEPISKKASVISISLEDAIPQRAKDFINTLINKYNQDAIDDKNLVSKNTADFIENRLTIINGELDLVESNATSFKERNKLTNIKSEADLFLNNVSETKKQILDTNTQLRLADFMLNYMQQNIGDVKLLPTNLGLSDASIATLIAKYNELVLERNRILKSSSLQNPVVVNLDAQLLTLEQSLEKSLNNVKQSLQIVLSDLNTQEKIIDAKITAIPQQEKEFRNIERQQQIKEALYLYLLQKREETAISLAVTAPNAKIIDAAFSDGIPVSPKKKIVLLAGLLIGLLIPFIIIYIKDLLDTKIHNRKDIEKQINVPVLGDIPADKSKDNIVMRGDIRSSTAEAFRLLRTNLDFLLANAEHNKAKTVFVTSTISGEGKTFIAINLAATLALSGKKVLLMGADLRAPKITQYLGMPERKGVTNYIMDAKLKYSDLLFEVPDLEGLDFISSGVVPPNPAELLLSPRVAQLFDETKGSYDYIIIDTAPVNLVTDTLLLDKYADLFIYVTRANYLDKRLLVVPETLYKEKRLNNMTILINDSDHKKGYGYGYGYGYGHSKANKSWWQRFFKASEKFSDSLKGKS